MKERGMMFNGDMVRALLNGRKTQTRRIMKPQPTSCPRGGHWWPSNIFKSMLHVEEEMQNGKGVWDGLVSDACPIGKVGDRIWVRETFSEKMDWEDGSCCAVNYSATSESPVGKKWKPSIHMPREHSRILLEITDVRIERLNSISEDDAQAEGAAPATHTITPPEAVYRVGFADLWRSIYGEESWKANLWVWAIEFKRIEEKS